MVRTDSFALVLSLIGGVVLLFIVAPLAGLVLDTPLANLFDVTKDEQVIDSIWLTLGTSFLGTFVCAIFAIPLAYVLARKEFPGKRLVLGIVDLPIVIPHSAAGIAVFGFHLARFNIWANGLEHWTGFYRTPHRYFNGNGFCKRSVLN